MPPLGARQNQSGRESLVVPLRCEAGTSAECTALAVVHQRASGTVITGTVPARRKPSSFGSSLNRFANKCPLSGLKRTCRLHCENPLMARSGHFQKRGNLYSAATRAVTPCVSLGLSSQASSQLSTLSDFTNLPTPSTSAQNRPSSMISSSLKC